MAVRDLFRPRDLRVVPNDLPDDTEESIVGIEWHQEAAGALASGLAAAAERRGASWGVCEEVALSGLEHLDGRPYTPRPDVFVLDKPITGRTAEVALALVGSPLLVAEIASDSTWRNDVGNKRAAYEGAGVREYIVFDPAGDYIAEQVRAWRLDDNGRFVPWSAENGVWASRTLDVAFVVEGPLLRVRDHDGAVLALPRSAPALLIEAQQHARDLETDLRAALERLQMLEGANGSDDQHEA